MNKTFAASFTPLDSGSITPSYVGKVHEKASYLPEERRV
jgi:hypothetical protein